MAFEVYMRQGSNYRSAPVNDVRRRAIQAMWKDGMSSAEIGRVLRLGQKDINRIIHRMRADGYDVPYRNARPVH
jgi:transposase